MESLIDPFTRGMLKKEAPIDDDSTLYLLVGGSGFLGISFSMAFSHMNKNWINIDLTGGNSSEFWPTSFVDINDERTLLNLKTDKRKKVLIHLAAPSTHVTYRDRQNNFKSNELLGLNDDEVALFKKIEMILDLGVASFIFASTIDVYGKNLNSYDVINEESTCDPDTQYAKAKFALESMYMQAAKSRAIPIKILRLGHIYGPFEHLYYSRLLTTLSASIHDIKNLRSHSKLILELPVKFCRQYIYTFDIFRMTLMLLELNSSITVNVVGKPVDAAELSAAYKTISGMDLQINSRGFKDDYGAEITSLYENINQFPRMSLSEGLLHTSRSRFVSTERKMVSRVKQ